MQKTSILLLLLVFLLTACGSPAPAVVPTDVPQPQAATATTVPVEPAVQPTTPPVEPVVQPTNPPAAPVIDGAALLEDRCSVCHSTNKAKQAPRTKSDWEKTVLRMIDKGAQLNEAEKQALIDHLAQTYGK